MIKKISKRRLDWLGHLARMPDERIPKISLFSWMPELHPREGPHKRWRDVIHTELKEMKIPEDAWYEKATTSRAEWRATYRQACTDITYREQYHEQATSQVQCPECQCTFRRESDMKRHKCWGKGSNQFQSTAEPCLIDGMRYYKIMDNNPIKSWTALHCVGSLLSSLMFCIFLRNNLWKCISS